ncbi:MAG: peroxiredoxin [Actinobacteria bacterium]|nr:peroxiredoxin [Actinomycetota bacterium]
MDDFAELGVRVIGMSVDSLKTQQNFAAKHDLRFPLIGDKERVVSARYLVLKSPTGSTERDTVVIGRDGIVVLAYQQVKAAGHAARVLQDVKAARAAGRL